MAAYQEPYLLFKRARKKGHVWYYRLAGEKTFHSTGKAKKWEAAEYVEDLIVKLSGDQRSLGEYLEPFFDWDRCPHITRLRMENKSISQKYAKEQRRRLEVFVAGDPICDIPIAQLKRSHLVDFRTRLFASKRDGKPVGKRTANLAMQALKVVLREAYFREDIDRDPTAGVGSVKYEEKETGVFTKKEIKALFEKRPGVWKDAEGYAAFLLAAHAGMRRSEVLALAWEQIDFKRKAIHIDRAQTDDRLPKWGKIRWTPITKQCIDALRVIRSGSMHILPHQPVFCDAVGEEHLGTWWTKRFRAAMNAAEIDYDSRNLKPHSFRHTLNTELRGAGVDPSRIREFLGWSGEQVQDGYTHWAPEHFEEQRKKTEEMYG